MKRLLLLLLVLFLPACAPRGETPTATEPPPTATLPPTPALIYTPLPTDTPTTLPPTLEPTPLPPTAQPTLPTQQIIIHAPVPGATVTDVITLRGWTALMPFEANLVVHIYDAAGQLAVVAPIMTQGEYGAPATIDARIGFAGQAGPGRIEVLDLSAADGSVLARATVNVTFTGAPGGGLIEIPAPLENVTLPLRILARGGTPGQTVRATLAWQHEDVQLARDFTLLPGSDGRGLLIGLLDTPVGVTVPPYGGPALLEIHTAEGVLLARQFITTLSAADTASTTTVTVYWVYGEEVFPETALVPRTPRIGGAALEVLLWGLAPNQLGGFQTMIPDPEEIATWPARQPPWGERVRLLDLSIVDGIATANFSGELAYWREDGGHAGVSIRARLIRMQIEQTLLQFSTVRQVRILVDGTPEPLLQP